LKLVSTVIPCPYPVGIEVVFGNMLGDILLRTKDRYDIDYSVLTWHIHHCYVEIDPDLFLSIGIQGHVRLNSSYIGSCHNIVRYYVPI